ncbi:hypothetical protein RJT34_21938 [Clitoria ternatea]|uniref:TIR domain-containing protein n=1 Tax=Clitoria ternatea TaxID=43366 RepID=A0AAN9P6F9_CLITE
MSKSPISSSSSPQWLYDVFLNFREDSTGGRNTFASRLYLALNMAGVNTIIRETSNKGKELDPELSRSIEGSRIAVVVFSENYPESSQCLEELVKIMDCHKHYGQLVMPIFYDVNPSHVRQQTGAFGKALEQLAEEQFEGRRVVDLLLRWGSALTQAANLSGWVSRASRNEAELLENIVEGVLGKLVDKLVHITEFPVGLESHVQEITRYIKNQSSKVCVIGIWGMGGVGKTTIAKAVYNHIHHNFVHRSFLGSIREICQIDNRGHIHLQKQLLMDVIKTKVEIHNIEMGITMIEKRLYGKKVLVVLDDVSNYKQVEALCANRKWIGQGSVMIITTRDVRILQILQVDHVFEMMAMNESESLELFSWHAFKEARPTRDFIALSRHAVTYCGGLPLALEVLGSYLYGRRIQEWESVLSKLKRIPNDFVHEKLKISYDGLLDYTEKNIFLDICCFFIGMDRAYVTTILNDCGFHSEIGISVLIEKGLIKIEKNNKLGMHDLLRDMGREIIRQSSPEEPEKRSRLWACEDVLDVLKEQTGTKAIEGLALILDRTSNTQFETKAFEKMKRLRLLKLNHVQLVGDYEHLPKHLRLVHWQGFPLKHIPDNFYLGDVVALDFKRSNITHVWKKPQLLLRLKFLNLSHSRYLMRTPDFSKLPNLEKLILKDCPNLSEIHPSIGDLSNILVINLKDCTSLCNLPRTIYLLKSLKTLILSGCSRISKLEEDIGQMESLTTLIADNTAVKQVPFSIVRSKSIGYISLCGYEGLARNVFPSIIWSWMSPTMNASSHMHPSQDMSSSPVYLDSLNNNLGDLAPIFGSSSKLRSVLVQCSSEVQLTQELRTIIDEQYAVNFTELETTSCASQVSDLSLRFILIGIGSCEILSDTLGTSISKGLNTGVSGGLCLPGDNYPYWLTHTGEGHSVSFRVPQDSSRCLKGMTLCVSYSSTLEDVTAECLVSILIVNYTNCTIHIYKRETAISFDDEEWQGIRSNLGPGDNMKIFVLFRHGFTVKKTVVYLVYGELIDTKSQLS